MDFERLFQRPRLSGRPIRLIVRGVEARQLPNLLPRILRLLSDRPPGDEIVFLSTGRAPSDFPLRHAGRRIRVRARSDADSGPALESALADCRPPAVVLVDADGLIDRDELRRLLSALDEVDLAVGRRPAFRRRALGWLLVAAAGAAGWMVGSLFSASWIGLAAGATLSFAPGWADGLVRFTLGVPIVDPRCPVKALRSAALHGMLLQTTGVLLDLELSAKMTFLTALIDEVPVTDRPGGRWSVGALLAEPAAAFSLLFFPRFAVVAPTPTRLERLSAPLPAPPPLDPNRVIGWRSANRFADRRFPRAAIVPPARWGPGRR